MDRQVREIALRVPVSASPEHSILEAEERLLERNETVLFVIDSQERLLGAVSDLDLLQYRLIGGDGGARISSLMSPVKFKIDSNASLSAACDLLKQQDCAVLPVLATDRLVGQLSRASLIKIIPKLQQNPSNHLVPRQVPAPAFLKFARSSQSTMTLASLIQGPP